MDPLQKPNICLACIIRPYLKCKCGWSMCYACRMRNGSMLYDLHTELYCSRGDLDLDTSVGGKGF